MSIPLLGARSGVQDLYAYALASAHHSYRVYDPDYALAKDPDIYEKIQRDPVIAKAFNIRLHGVAGRQWHCLPGGDNPEDKLVAKMCEEALKEIRHFSEARRIMASAVIRGRAFGYIESERKLLTLANTAPREWWIPTGIADVDPRRFRLVNRWNAGKLTVVHEMFSIEERQWFALEHPEYYVKVTFNDEEARLGYGRGLLEALYFYHWIKGEILKEGLHGIKRWARGTTIAKIDGLRMASAGADDRSNDTIKRRFIEALQRQEEEHILVVDKNDEIENQESTGTGHQMVMDTIRYLDGAMVSLIDGSLLPFGGGEDVGSKARAETELDVHESLIQFDREKIDEDLTHDLIGLWVILNRANFVELGLGGARKPKFETVQEKQEDTVKNSQVIASATAAGLDIRKDEAYQKLGLTPPQVDDEVIKGRDPMANPLGSPFDSGEFDNAMPSKESARLARALIKLGTKPEEAVKCAVETIRLNGVEAVATPATQPPPPAPVIHLNNPVTVHAAAPAASAPINMTSQIHLPEKIMLEAARQEPQPINVTVQPAPVEVHMIPAPAQAPPKVEVYLPQQPAPAAPKVDVVVNVTPKLTAEVILPVPFKLELPPMRKTVEFTKGKDGGIVGAEIEVKAA
jgi:hypothetical protein